MKFNFKIISKSISLGLYYDYLKNLLKKYGIKHSSVKLPHKRKFFTVLKSPHVNKKAMEQFETIEYKILVFIETENIILLNKLFFIVLQNKPKYLKIFIRKII
jgi:ribosomal protein S10